MSGWKNAGDFIIMAKLSLNRKSITKRFAKTDVWAIGLLLTIGIVSFLAVRIFMGGQDGAMVRISLDGELYGTYRLSEEQTVLIRKSGAVTNTLQISGHKAKMAEADCPDRLCVHQNAISRQGETIVCLPNKVVVEVEGGEGPVYDSISR